MTDDPQHHGQARREQLHREQREALGAFALGQLGTAEHTGLQAHLDGCPECRAELAEIASVVPDLSSLNPADLGDLVSPPPQLGTAIRAALARERAALTRQRARRTVVMSAAACIAIAAVLAAGVVVGQRTAGPATPLTSGQPSRPPSIPMEQVTLRPMAAGVTVSSAFIVAHTWGVELRFVAVGLRDQETYRAAFRATDGSLRPAGEFIGVGAKKLTCNMQSALLRRAATEFVVLDASGRLVLEATLKT